MEIWNRNAVVLTLVFYIGLDSVAGTDVGKLCKEDSECWEGNGGKYSACSNFFHVCVCTRNIQGEVPIYSTVCDDTACVVAGFCTRECAPKEILKWPSNQDWYGVRPEPFAANFIHDKETPVCFDPDRAFNSVPEGFVIKNSTIPGAGFGVFTDRYLQRDTILGPYKGIIEPDTDIAVESGYSWKLREDSVRPQLTWVDAKYKNQSNWLRYMNMPTSNANENVVALQHQGEMYYQVFKSVPAGEELMVHYGDEYAEFLNIEKYPAPTYYYGHREYVGGSCHSGEGAKCLHDNNGICVDKTCLCKPGSHFRYGACITDGTLGGRCYDGEGNICKNDANAICQRGICVCKENSTPVNNICVQDETFGGRCAGKTGDDCLLDTNAECVYGVCDCKYATTAIYGVCVTDGAVGGRCKSRDGTRCKVDRNAECWGGLCDCKIGATEIDGKCMIDEMVGGTCKGLDSEKCLLDPNAQCLSGKCVCKEGTSQVGWNCAPEEVYGGRCSGQNNSVCSRDNNALCINGFCACRDGASLVEGKCVPDERLGGKCSGSNGWPCRLDRKAVCLNGRCECRAGTSTVNGACVADGDFGGLCKKGLCRGNNVVCDTSHNKCICSGGFAYQGGRCIHE